MGVNRSIAGIVYGSVAFSWKCFGIHFLCFCRCRNYKELLEELIFQNTPKLVLVTPDAFGAFWGDLVVASCGCTKSVFVAVLSWILCLRLLAGTRNSHSRRGSIMNFAFQSPCWHSKFAFPPQVIFAFKRVAGIANSRVHLWFYSDICCRAHCWYSEFAFSPQIL